MDLIGPIIEIFNCTCPPLCKYVQYHRKLDEKMNDLKRVLQELNSKKKDVEATLKAECDQGNKQPSNEVNDWLKNVERINREAESIEQEVKKGKYFARARLGKDVEGKIQEVEKYHQQGCPLTSLVIVAPPTSKMKLPTTRNLAGEKTGKIMEEIWEDLMGDKVSKIGVWGMGGIGKTTIMKEINNRLMTKTSKFSDVIWVAVSQPLILNELQNEIAAALNQSLPATENKERRAGMLLRMLEAKEKFVLILDDMWEAFRLEEVGIPEPNEENGCKFVITTRKWNVCSSMGCKQVRVELLSKEEALNLFIDEVGSSFSQVTTVKEEIINSVVEECAGLPLAIVTIAGSMKDVEEIHEWRNALNELRGQSRSLNDEYTKALGQLKFSYNRLKDKKVQQCFLYCALYPEDFVISKDELIDYWIAEGFIEEVKDVQAKYDRGHTILNRLVNCCLLERVDFGSCVKMHDLIRDMALGIISESPSFMVQASMRLLEFPGEHEWKENLERVSLIGNDIKEIPSNMSPHCPTLSTLLLQRNRNLQRIPECFFVHMHWLKILNLSVTDIEVLPNSISDLTNLISLLLHQCRRLKRVPSLAKLLALQDLDLQGTSLEEVPEGMEMLENLVHLNLYSQKLKKLPAVILRRKRDLYKLQLYFGRQALRETVEEAAILSKRLDTFEGHFSELNDFNIYVKSSDGGGSKNYHFQVNPEKSKFFNSPFTEGTRKQLRGNKSVCIMNKKISGVTIVLPKDVESLIMGSILDVTSLNDVLPRDQGLVNIGKFSHDLKVLSFVDCHNLKKLFSPQLLPALQNLEYLLVSSCRKIEEIIAVNDEETEKEGTNAIINTVTLPRLKKLFFLYLRELKSVCGGNVALVCNSLQNIDVVGCPKLKRLSLSLPLLDNGQPSPPPALEVIKIRKELWESLEWDQANAKDVLNPFCKFV